jgi:hypothetical protein
MRLLVTKKGMGGPGLVTIYVRFSRTFHVVGPSARAEGSRPICAGRGSETSLPVSIATLRPGPGS